MYHETIRLIGDFYMRSSSSEKARPTVQWATIEINRDPKKSLTSNWAWRQRRLLDREVDSLYDSSRKLNPHTCTDIIYTHVNIAYIDSKKKNKTWDLFLNLRRQWPFIAWSFFLVLGITIRRLKTLSCQSSHANVIRWDITHLCVQW